MNLFVLVVIADVALAPQPRTPRADAADRLVKECPAAKLDTPACQALVAEVELLAIRELRFIEAAQLPVDRELVRTAAASRNCGLAGAGLRLLAAGGPLDKTDERIVAGALMSPCPGVRRLAFTVVQKTSGRFASWPKRDYGTAMKDQRSPILPYVEEAVPTEKGLGVPVYPGAEYVYFASGRRRAFFFTTDPPDKVAAFYAAGGKKVRTLAEVESPPKPAQVDPNEIMRRIRAGEDPRKVTAELQAAATAPTDLKQWLAGVKGEPGVVDPRFIEVAPARYDATGATPARGVVVFRDEIFGGTAIVVPRAEAPPVKPPTGEAIMEDLWAKQAVDRATPR